jgi:hypothetical protein
MIRGVCYSHGLDATAVRVCVTGTSPITVLRSWSQPQSQPCQKGTYLFQNYPPVTFKSTWAMAGPKIQIYLFLILYLSTRRPSFKSCRDQLQLALSQLRDGTSNSPLSSLFNTIKEKFYDLLTTFFSDPVKSGPAALICMVDIRPMLD